jgi:hypothetical protein
MNRNELNNMYWFVYVVAIVRQFLFYSSRQQIILDVVAMALPEAESYGD